MTYYILCNYVNADIGHYWRGKTGEINDLQHFNCLYFFLKYIRSTWALLMENVKPLFFGFI